MEKQYIAIDLKSFYASVECVERGLDPLTANLVVADTARTEKTICLAVSPSLKAHGISGRARLFEVVQRVKEVNGIRKKKAPGGKLTGRSVLDEELRQNPALAVDYIVAKPRMALYMKRSTEIYEIYLKYVAPEDLHIYSVDEVFIDATAYLSTYRKTARELASDMMRDVLRTTGITATAGIGTNLYLCKVAMDVVAKHILPNADGMRIAELNEHSYRSLLWSHRPITDFWRVGKGYADKLAAHGIYTMGDVARVSVGGKNDFYNEDLLYKLFGVNAELLIDHAWGWESCTMADIKAYRPGSKSLGMGQVLSVPYPFEKGKLVLREMAEHLTLDLVDKGFLTDQMVLTIGYDVENLNDPARRAAYGGEITRDRYGREIPKQAHGSIHLGGYTSSTRRIVNAVMDLFDRIVQPDLLIRRINLCANRILPEGEAKNHAPVYEQMDLFTDYEKEETERKARQEEENRERTVQKAMIGIQKRFGKNAILKGMNLEDGATAIERNGQIGGHKA